MLGGAAQRGAARSCAARPRAGRPGHTRLRRAAARCRRDAQDKWRNAGNGNGLPGAGAAEDTPQLPPPSFGDSSRPRYNTGFRFDRARWEDHRDETRYWRWAGTLLGSRLIKRTLPPAIFLAALAAGIQVWNVLSPEVYAIKGLPLRSFALSTTFVGLLLVFRTNGSYQRFKEGLTSFVECLYANRNLVRQALAWLTPEEALLRERFLEYSAAWSFTLTYHLLYDREEPGDIQVLRDGLASVGCKPVTIDRITAAHNRPTYVAQTLSLLVARSSVSEQKKTEMDRVLTKLLDAMGKCERLRQHPIPISYTRLTSYTLLFWSLGLAFAITPPLGIAGVPVILFLSLALLGIEDVGVQIEEPFNYLPLWEMCFANSMELWEMKRQALDIARNQAAWDSDLADSMTLWQTQGTEGARMSNGWSPDFSAAADAQAAAHEGHGDDIMPRAPPLYLSEAVRREYGAAVGGDEALPYGDEQTRQTQLGEDGQAVRGGG